MIKISPDPICPMMSYAKLSGNSRRFKTIMGMSLQEFDLLFAKVNLMQIGHAGPSWEMPTPTAECGDAMRRA